MLAGIYGLDTLVVLIAAISVARLAGVAPRGGTIVLALLATLPLLGRRRWPLAAPVLALTGLLGLSLLVPGAAWEQLQLFLGALLCFWVIGSDNERRPAVAGLVIGLAVAAITVTADRGHRGVSDFVFAVAITVAAWGAGVILGTHARSAAAARRRAEQLAFEQKLREREAAEQERARIARELHDVIAHTVSVMVVQAGAAEEVLQGENAAARAALAAIRQSGKGALEELRRLLGLLREAAASPVTAQASLDRLGELVTEVGELGLRVELTETGSRQPLPSGLDQAAYRIVQEALTNTVKHAGASRATVALEWESAAVVLRVTDDGHGANGGRPGNGQRNGQGPGGPGGGHGLIGMRERAALYGGSLDAGPRAGGGFSVQARLPL